MVPQNLDSCNNIFWVDVVYDLHHRADMNKVRMPQVLSKSVELYERVLTLYLEKE